MDETDYDSPDPWQLESLRCRPERLSGNGSSPPINPMDILPYFVTTPDLCGVGLA